LFSIEIEIGIPYKSINEGQNLSNLNDTNIDNKFIKLFKMYLFVIKYTIL